MAGGGNSGDRWKITVEKGIFYAYCRQKKATLEAPGPEKLCAALKKEHGYTKVHRRRGRWLCKIEVKLD